ncbi:ECF-type sigma factor [Photobacterium nomapromontoriensis]|uniref:ECF-type sigma factor n=1 Tax=Photobacterium nomapromontoriensis TaxID=2910237 RepID=UPI003D1193CF
MSNVRVSHTTHLDTEHLFQGWQSRDKSQSDAFFTAAYRDIYTIVENLRRQQDPSKTLLRHASTTELTHEAIVKLNRWRHDETPITQRKEFIDYVRCSVWHLLFADQDQYQQRLSHKERYFALQQENERESLPDYFLNHDLHNALLSLRDRYPNEAEVFEYKHFSDIGNSAIAEILNVSERTVNNRLLFATNYLRKKLA